GRQLFRTDARRNAPARRVVPAEDARRIGILHSGGRLERGAGAREVAPGGTGILGNLCSNPVATIAARNGRKFRRTRVARPASPTEVKPAPSRQKLLPTLAILSSDESVHLAGVSD